MQPPTPPPHFYINPPPFQIYPPILAKNFIAYQVTQFSESPMVLRSLFNKGRGRGGRGSNYVNFSPTIVPATGMLVNNKIGQKSKGLTRKISCTPSQGIKCIWLNVTMHTSYSYSSKNPISFLSLPHLFKNNITTMILSLGLQISFHWKVGTILSCW